MPKNGDDVNGTPLIDEGPRRHEVPGPEQAVEYGAQPDDPPFACREQERGDSAFSFHPGDRSWG